MIPAADVREPQAAIWGFYPFRREELVREIERCFLDKRWGPGSLPQRGAGGPWVVGGVAPHAGYSYSGPCAAHLYKAIGESPLRPDTVVVVGTNHSGYGGDITTATQYRVWATPLGEVEVDREFIEELKKLYPPLDDDPVAHMREHSVEVQLPFLQYVLGEGFRLVPVVVKWIGEVEARDFARAVYRVSQELGRRVVVIASSDFTHHGPMYGYTPFSDRIAANVRRLDMGFIEEVLKLDTRSFLNKLRRYDATVCGPGAVAIAMEYAKLVGAKARLLMYYNSAELTGDESAAVGYAAVAFIEDGEG